MKQRNLITVVTGHQLTADTIAKALGASEKHEGYYLGNGYAVTWTNGSVIEATFKADESFVLSTTMDPRLVYAHNFKFAMRDYDNLLGYKKTEQDKRQLATIKVLWKMSHTVVNAMSPDIEGDTDFLSLYYFLAIPVTVRRAWLPILTKGEIIKGVTNGVKDAAKYEEWLSKEIYNLVVKHTEENTPKPTHVFVEVPVATATEEVKELVNVGIENAVGGSVTITGEAIYSYTDKPTLHNLPQLLIDAAVQLDFGHDKTIRTALTLYSKKLISYPLVKQNYIPYEVWKMMLRNREVLRHNTKWGKTVRRGGLSKRHNFEGCENEHYGFGIVTTGLHPTDLTRDEERLYNLIVKRVLDAFRPAKRYGRKKRNRKHSVKSAKTA